VQLIAGRQDRWIPLASLSRAVERIPGVSLAVEEGGHLLPEEKPEVIVRALLAGVTRDHPSEPR
jgi:pimeloyl-ACP methyl ester carboxylesterase